MIVYTTLDCHRCIGIEICRLRPRWKSASQKFRKMLCSTFDKITETNALFVFFSPSLIFFASAKIEEFEFEQLFIDTKLSVINLAEKVKLMATENLELVRLGKSNFSSMHWPFSDYQYSDAMIEIQEISFE